MNYKVNHAIGVARILLGFVFLWAFLDKLFGLGFATPPAKSWLHGGSPTKGFLLGVDGPFADIFHMLVGQAWADGLFMIGLAGLGVALLFGVGLRIAAISGTALLILLWAASLPLKVNPFVDEHIVYAAFLWVIYLQARVEKPALSLAVGWQESPKGRRAWL